MGYKKFIKKLVKQYGSVDVFDGEEVETFKSAKEAIALISDVEEAEVTWPTGWALILPDLDKDEQIADMAGNVPKDFGIEIVFEADF